jgi:hypothetical protein
LLANPPVERIQKGIELANNNGWEATVANMQRLIKEAITRDDRPSKQKITPLPNAELEYLYTPTQGS